jgi:hypothetical protein
MIYSLRMRTCSIYVLSVDDDEDRCIRLLSFCKKHRQPSHDHSVADERVPVIGQCSDYEPPPNPSGCARSGMILESYFT